MKSLIPETSIASNPYLNRIKALLGDITQQEVGAIVSVLPQTLEYRGAINAALLEAAGKDLNKFISENITTPKSGDIYAIPAFNLPCQHIFFCIVPDWKDDFDRNDRDLVNACRKAMELARSMNIKTIAFPPIGSGKRGFPKGRAARLIIEGITSRLSHDIDEVRIICQNKATLHLFNERLLIA